MCLRSCHGYFDLSLTGSNSENNAFLESIQQNKSLIDWNIIMWITLYKHS
jgi:hypothetical protein